jgi:thiamine-monophosphate kinase
VVHPKQPPEKGDRSPTGEDAAIQRIGMHLKSRFGGPPPGEIWSGDDAAVVALPGVAGGHASLLLTTDAVVAGVHIDLAVVGLADVGWKALTVAISDIAAMGGTPAHALVAVGAPPGTDLDEIAAGIGEAAEHWCCPVVGGDLTSASEVMVSVAVTGSLEGPAHAVLRSGARPGDALYVTGRLGASAAGLRLLRDGPASVPALDETERAALELAHRRPRARLAEGLAAREAGATAMMDISDGLGIDLDRLARASGVGFVLDEVPVAPGATPEEARSGGEDYELLIAAPDDGSLPDRFGVVGLRPPHRIGVCTADGGERRLGDGTLEATGYEHRF